MKIGVKSFGEENFLKYFEDKADFFEIMAVQGTNYSFLKNFLIPIIIHAEHQGFGINPADIPKKEQNLKSLNFARKIADYVNANKIIVHPGIMEKGNKNCNLENAINFFERINDERILIENIPPRKEWDSLCDTSEKTKYFINEIKSKFCFDVNHAFESAGKVNGDYNFIKKYLELNPLHYHLGGQKLSEGKEHLYFSESDLDLKKILNYYPFRAEITLETGTDAKRVKKDLEIIKNVLRELRSNKY